MGQDKKVEFKMRGWVMMIVEKVWKMIKERMLLMGKFGGGIKRQPQRRGKDRGILREYEEQMSIKFS